MTPKQLRERVDELCRSLDRRHRARGGLAAMGLALGLASAGLGGCGGAGDESQPDAAVDAAVDGMATVDAYGIMMDAPIDSMGGLLDAYGVPADAAVDGSPDDAGD